MVPPSTCHDPSRNFPISTKTAAHLNEIAREEPNAYTFERLLRATTEKKMQSSTLDPWNIFYNFSFHLALGVRCTPSTHREFATAERAEIW